MPVARNTRLGRRALLLVAFGRRKNRRVLEHHAAAEHRDLLELVAAERVDGRVEARGDDALVLGEQVVGVLMEVADPADLRGAGDEVIAVFRQLR